ncbi:MAG: hypothetical protein H0T62_10635 [Parachlamydiaceae bacterium]|nr:hypothetical protein [Parachlamydiaceae bacterium]
MNEIAKEGKEVINLQSTSYFVEAFRGIQIDNPVTILDNLEEAEKIAEQAWENREDLTLHTGLIDFVTGLPLDVDFWQEVIQEDPEKAENLIEKLGVLSSYFLKSCYTVRHPEIINPEKVYVMRKMVHLQHLICIVGHSNSEWGQLAFPDIEINKYCKFTNKKIANEIARMTEMNKNVEREAPIFDLFPPDNVSVSWTQTQVHLFLYKEKNTFIEMIREIYPDIVNQVIIEDEASELPETCQNAHILISNHLPDWIKAMRDTSFSYQHLTKANAGTLTELDRKSHIQLQYAVKDDINNRESSIFVTLTAVTEEIFRNKETRRVRDEDLSFMGNYTKKPSSFLEAFNLINPKFNDHKEGFLSTAELSEKFKYESKKNLKKYSEDLEFKEILRFFATGVLGHVELLEYFTKHPEKLNEREYQIFFHLCLFGNQLEDNLSVKGFNDSLYTFIQKNYRFLVDQNAMQPAVFLMKVSSQLQSFCPDKEFYSKTLVELQILLEKKGLDAETKGLIIAEIVAELGEKETLDDQEIRKLISGSIYLRENKIESKDQEDPDTMRKAESAMIKHAFWIGHLLKEGNPNQDLLNGIVKDLRPNAEQKNWVLHEKEGTFPWFVSEDGELILHPLLCELRSEGGHHLLPLVIRDNTHFNNLFPDIERCKILPNGVYSFKDAQQNETLVCMVEDKIVIDKQMKNFGKGFYRFIPSLIFLEKVEEDLKSKIGSRTIVQDFDLWQTLNVIGHTTILALDRETGEKCYEIETNVTYNGNFILGEVYEVPDYLKLGIPSSLLTDFEDPSYIHEWYDDSNMRTKLELPRFNLTFTLEKASGKYICGKPFEGFFLNPEKEIKKLGSHHHYLVLENVEGLFKVLLPVQKTEKPEELEVLLPRYDLKRDLEPGNRSLQKYYVYDGEELFHKSREVNLHLAEVMATTQQYSKAFHLLKKVGFKTKAYSPLERGSLENITNISKVTGDKSGNGIAIRLFTRYLLMKNAHENHLEVSKKETVALKEEYDLYLDHFNTLTAFKLPRYQEIFLLKALLAQAYSPVHHLRLQELDPAAARNVIRAEGVLVTKPIDTDCDIDRCQFKFTGYLEKLDDQFLTRLRMNVCPNNFNLYYETARSGKEGEKKWMKDALHFLKVTEDGKYSGYAKILEAVLNEPENFSEFPFKKEIDEIDEWAEGVFASAKDYSKRMRENEKTTPTFLKDLTPKNFRLEEKRKIGEIVTVSYRETNIDLPTWSEIFPCLKKNIKKAETSQIDACKSTIESIQLKDPVAKKEQSRLVKDLDAVPGITIYQFNTDQEHLETIKEFLKDEAGSGDAIQVNLLTLRKIINTVSIECKQQLPLLLENILELANKEPSTIEERRFCKIQKFANSKKVLTPNELINFYARNNPTALCERNPTLTSEEAEKLFQMIQEYLILSTREQKNIRLEGKLEPLESLENYDTPHAEALINDFGGEYTSSRDYKPQEHPAYLAFEYYCNVLMRPAQVEKLESFLKGDDENLVMEMIMGSGKSKCFCHS